MSPGGSFEDYCDTVQIGIDSESSFATSAMPLIPVLELRFHLEEKKDYGYRAETPYYQWGRRYRASWVIEDNKLYFNVEGSLEGKELSYQLLFSNFQDAEGNPTLVPATWFSGKFLIFIDHYLQDIDDVRYVCNETRKLMIENGLVTDDEAIYEQEKYIEMPF
ncbi:MAG: hypothetical protein U5N85_11750 [Arcicella sp.]|nr:hypothetical protein [Arcicella sp.]